MQHPVTGLTICRVAYSCRPIAFDVARRHTSLIEYVQVKLLGTWWNILVLLVVPVVRLDEKWTPRVQIQ